MTVNWTPFLTLFPLRFPPAKDIFGFLLCLWLCEEGESASSEFRCPGRLRSWLRREVELTGEFQTPSSRRPISFDPATTASSLPFGCMFVALCRLPSRPPRLYAATRSFATRKRASSVVKTKKKLSELPRAKLLADGTAAAPLEPFNGGLGIRKSTRRRSSAPFLTRCM